MGHFTVSARLTGPTGRSEDVGLLVDTGATFVLVPRIVADRLELQPTRVCSARLAGGGTEIWPLGEVRVTLDGLEATTPCVIGPEGPALLGTVALESLLLAVDPAGKRLVPIDAIFV